MVRHLPNRHVVDDLLAMNATDLTQDALISTVISGSDSHATLAAQPSAPYLEEHYS